MNITNFSLLKLHERYAVVYQDYIGTYAKRPESQNNLNSIMNLMRICDKDSNNIRDNKNVKQGQAQYFQNLLHLDSESKPNNTLTVI